MFMLWAVVGWVWNDIGEICKEVIGGAKKYFSVNAW